MYLLKYSLSSPYGRPLDKNISPPRDRHPLTVGRPNPLPSLPPSFLPSSLLLPFLFQSPNSSIPLLRVIDCLFLCFFSRFISLALALCMTHPPQLNMIAVWKLALNMHRNLGLSSALEDKRIRLLHCLLDESIQLLLRHVPSRLKLLSRHAVLHLIFDVLLKIGINVGHGRPIRQVLLQLFDVRLQDSPLRLQVHDALQKRCHLRGGLRFVVLPSLGDSFDALDTRAPWADAAAMVFLGLKIVVVVVLALLLLLSGSVWVVV